MANISIYGTLVNDTGEPIVRADQVLDPESGKMLTEILGQSGQGEPMEELTQDDILSIIDEIEQTTPESVGDAV